MSFTNVFYSYSNICQKYISTFFIKTQKLLLIFTFAITWYRTAWFRFYSSLCFFKIQVWKLLVLSYLTLLVHKSLFSYIKHTLVSPYYMHLLSIQINFWFPPVTAFHYYPIFFLCPLVLNLSYRRFITFTRSSLDSFR